MHDRNIDHVAEIAVFGGPRAWEPVAPGDEPLERAAVARDDLRGLWREAHAARAAVASDRDLSDTGKAKAIAQIAGKIEKLDLIAKDISPAEHARGQLRGHRREWAESQPADPANGSEIRGWLSADPLENRRELEQALVAGDQATAAAIMHAPPSWPGAIDPASIQAARDHIYQTEFPEKASRFADLDDAVKIVEQDIGFIREEILVAAGMATEPAIVRPLAG
jgi:hypothetical protein